MLVVTPNRTSPKDQLEGRYDQRTVARTRLPKYLLDTPFGRQRKGTHPPTPSCLGHGRRKGHAVGAEQYLVQRCSEVTCVRTTYLQCFDCDRPYCTLHLTCVRVALLTGDRSFLLCRMCLHAYVDDPDFRHIIAVDAEHRDC